MSGVKCINRRIKPAALSLALTLLLCSCGDTTTRSYDVYETSHQYGLLKNTSRDPSPLFATDLIVAENTNIGMDEVPSFVAQAAGLFNVTTGEVRYAQNIFDLAYPASTTKVMTALVALKYGDLDKEVTVSENALNIDADSSVADLRVGDVVSIRQLLYGLMLPSGNDAAVAIAEGVSGSTEAFVDQMNKEAALIGATNTHYITTNGLPDDDHYTTVYDMYLIFQAACQYDDFVEIIKSPTYEASYRDANGQPVNRVWKSTVRYVDGRADPPAGITIIGGKTGTTFEAGYCIVYLAKNEKNEELIGVLFHCDNRANLYYLSNQILAEFGNS